MAPASDDFGSDGFSPNSGTNRLRQAMATDTSPDSKCPICLDRFENVAYLNHFYHRFCFRCVQEWSRNKAECPLCKQPFHSIIHSMRSDDDLQRMDLLLVQMGDDSWCSKHTVLGHLFSFGYLSLFGLATAVKYHLLPRPYGIVEVKPRIFPGDTILETGEVVPPLEIPSSHH